MDSKLDEAMIAITQADIEEILQDVIVLYLKPKIRELDRVASGELINNIEIVVTDNNKGVIKVRDYAYYLVVGREPNKNQSPEAIMKFARGAGATYIADWVRDKGLDLNPFAVAYNIAKKGHKKKNNQEELQTILSSTEVIDFIQKQLHTLASVNIQANFHKQLTQIFKQ